MTSLIDDQQSPPLTLVATACLKVLTAATPETKVMAARQAGQLLEMLRGCMASGGYTPLDWPVELVAPTRPARPQKPILVDPGDVPRRKLGSIKGRASLLHAIAHIEFNAIDLAFDMALRFSSAIHALGLDSIAFAHDWISVGSEEADHFSMISTRLAALDCAYGDMPAHDGLWDAAISAADDVMARLAIAPMVLEARGLDVTPGMIKKLNAVGDKVSATILQRIYNDEIGHVRIGTNWFNAVCTAKGVAPLSTFHHLVATRFAGQMKEPFNIDARAQAGLDLAFYKP